MITIPSATEAANNNEVSELIAEYSETSSLFANQNWTHLMLCALIIMIIVSICQNFLHQNTWKDGSTDVFYCQHFVLYSISKEIYTPLVPIQYVKVDMQHIKISSSVE